MKSDTHTISLVDSFFKDAPVLDYAKGANILRAEDVPYGVYYLKAGYVRQYLLSSSGETFIIHIYKPGSFFPLPWILNDIPNMFYFEAMTKASIIRGSKEQFLKFLDTHPTVMKYTAQRLAAGMHGLVSRVGQLVLDDAYRKTVLLLLYYADNFGKKTRDSIIFEVPLAHREIASWIGTTRETASLQIEKLQKKGIITSHGRLIVIQDLAMLQREARTE
jgi:CRP/FNR family transcriptional regulator